MKVIATQAGYYESFRKAGDEFTISGAKAFSKVWMKKAPKAAPLAQEDQGSTEAVSEE